MSDYDRYRDDPVLFFEKVLHFTPWSKQREIALAVRDHERVAVKAANATGKTAAASALIPWWLAGGPGSICVTTATTERQVKRVLWRETHRRFKPARVFFRGVTLTDTEAFLASDWFALGLSSDETEAVQGFHGSRVLVIVDEASGVDERVFAAVDGLLAGGDTRLLLLGNPLRTSGTFFDAWHRDREHWHTITISAFDTPAFTGEDVPRAVRRKLVTKRWCDRMAKRGRNSNEYRMRVLAEFPTEADDSVIALGDLERAHAQTFEPTLPLVIGVDVARFGCASAWKRHTGRCSDDRQPRRGRRGGRAHVVGELSGSEIPEVFEPPGSSLYHYTRLATAVELILPSWRLRLSPFSKMRDPRESKHWGYEAPRTPSMSFQDEFARFVELQRLAENLKDRVKVLSLTEDDHLHRDEEGAVFGRGFAHPRLWEHYADDHRGVCLCFDREVLTRLLTGRLGSQGSVQHGPVTYVDREIAPDALRFVIEDSRDLPTVEALHKHFDAHVHELFFTKLCDWETEREYRFVVRTDDTDYLEADVSQAFRAVIIGADVSTQYLPALSALCDPQTIAIHRVQWQHGRPRLTNPRAKGFS